MNKIYEKFNKPTKYLRKQLMFRQEGKCKVCNIDEWKLIDNTFHIHRIIKKGKYDIDNCILVCPKCHSKIHNEEVTL